MPEEITPHYNQHWHKAKKSTNITPTKPKATLTPAQANELSTKPSPNAGYQYCLWVYFEA